MNIIKKNTACEMKYYDFVSYGWCHIRERSFATDVKCFLYTTRRGSTKLC